MTDISRRALFGFAAALPFLGKAAAAAPAISGVATVGAPLVGVDLGASDAWSYCWMRDGKLMMTGPTYTLTEGDVGREISVRLAR